MKQIALYDRDELLEDVRAIVQECLNQKESTAEKEAAQDEIWTAKDVASHFKLSQTTIYRYVSENKLPSYKPNGRRIFYKSEVIEAMKIRYDLT